MSYKGWVEWLYGSGDNCSRLGLYCLNGNFEVLSSMDTRAGYVGSQDIAFPPSD